MIPILLEDEKKGCFFVFLAPLLYFYYVLIFKSVDIKQFKSITINLVINISFYKYKIEYRINFSLIIDYY